MNPAARRLSLHFLAWCAVLCVLSPSLQAQFVTNITLNKETYLTYETVEATVTISNRSGADVVMGGPDGQAWMVFEVTDPEGDRVSPVRMRSDETMVFKSGTTVSRKVLLSDYHAFSEYGSYGVIANIYHPPSQQFFASNRTRANFTEAKPFWQQNFGVPLGQRGAGQIRRYTLSLLRDTEHTHLYVRVLDDRTGIKLSTLALGTCIMVADPQVTLDSGNNLHVLYMARPHIYAHALIDTQGRMVKGSFYKELQSNRPQLVVQSDQSIGVQGGVPYDPAAAGKSAVKARSIGDKPPGL